MGNAPNSYHTNWLLFEAGIVRHFEERKLYVQFLVMEI